MNETNYSAILPRLGRAIDTALATWEAYLDICNEYPTYESIVSNNTKDVTMKAKALQHLLEVLPARYKAIVQSYSDSSLEPFLLSSICADLLGGLKNPDSGLDLDAWFNRTLTTRKTISGVAQLEKDIKSGELGRLQELRRLKAIHMSLTDVLADGELGKKGFEVMLEAMEALGVSLADCGAANANEAASHGKRGGGHGPIDGQ